MNDEAIAATKEFLSQNGWPAGLQSALISSLPQTPNRFFIVDDSGSMNANDGHILKKASNGATILTDCTRWEEVVASVSFHADLANVSQCASEFRLLNGGTYMIGTPDGDMRRFNSLKHIGEVVSQITALKDQLLAAGHRAVVVIATDGESSDGNLVQAMKPLEHLPVWVVVKLCTDDEKVVNYWNNIDSQLEMELDVLDDLIGESEEIRENNPWLTYGMPLHRLREWGITIKEIDMLDSHKLSSEQIRTVCATILGGRPIDFPHPEEDRDAFLKAVTDANQTLTWSPYKRRNEKWIREEKLFQTGCSIM